MTVRLVPEYEPSQTITEQFNAGADEKKGLSGRCRIDSRESASHRQVRTANRPCWPVEDLPSRISEDEYL